MARRLSLFTRLFLGNLLLVGVIMLVAGLVSYYSLEGRYRQEMLHALLWAGLAAALAAVALGLLMSWLWYAPLRRVAATARQIASGRLAVRAQLGGEDELGQLGQALNDMRENLSRQIATVEGQRQTLDTVLASLRDGVVAMDSADRVVFINQAARELLGVGADEAIGRPLRELVGRLDIVDLYHQAGERPLSRQVETDGGGPRRTLEVQAARLERASQAIRGLVVVRDVTEAARSAGMKAEFVANASHELRTPLAAIRAAVDSLLELGPADPAPRRAGDAVASPAAQAKLLAILDRHVARLQAMTNDLLDLHVVEVGRVRLKIEDVRLDQLAEWARGQFAARAQGKSLRCDVAVEALDQVFRCDQKLLQLIVQNLVDNAIKFTSAGGQVRCELAGGQEGLTIRVSDTGCGIRPEDQPKVFDRFFQADAARSGDHRVRGTGLGLAIVKHAAERLGGKISLVSEVGKGTTVTIHVPGK